MAGTADCGRSINLSSPKRSVILSSYERGHDRDEQARTATSSGPDVGVEESDHAEGGSDSSGPVSAASASIEGEPQSCWASRLGSWQSRTSFTEADRPGH